MLVNEREPTLARNDIHHSKHEPMRQMGTVPNGICEKLLVFRWEPLWQKHDAREAIVHTLANLACRHIERSESPLCESSIEDVTPDLSASIGYRFVGSHAF